MKNIWTKSIVKAEYGVYVFRAFALVLLGCSSFLILWFYFQGNDKWITFIAPIGFAISALLVSFTSILQIQNSITDKERDRLDKNEQRCNRVLFLLYRLKSRINYHFDKAASVENSYSEVVLQNIKDIDWIWKELSDNDCSQVLLKYSEELISIDGIITGILATQILFKSDEILVSQQPHEINTQCKEVSSKIDYLYQKIVNEINISYQKAHKKTRF
jgi:hypothetical protein